MVLALRNLAGLLISHKISIAMPRLCSMTLPMLPTISSIQGDSMYSSQPISASRNETSET